MSLPDWLQALPDAAQMRAIDAWAIEQRQIPALDLMERAGAGLARVVEGVAPDGAIGVLCGKGNNGADGLVAARLLREAGRQVTVIAVGSLQESSPQALENLRRLPGEAPVAYGSVGLGGFAACVDALLGTGASGEPRGVVRDAIAALGGAGVAVVSADVPSGVDASTGEAAEHAVHAVATATFHAAKPGLWINPGKEHAGDVHVLDIGIPSGGPDDVSTGLIGAGVLASLPRRGAASTKFVSGHVLVVGGSRGLTGAPCMAAMAAGRAGAGYVTACVPASLQAIFEARLLEVMTRGLPDEDGALNRAGVDTVIELLARGGALALGPGIGRSDCAGDMARELARDAPVPLVLDADGLNAHAGRLSDLAGRQAPTVLTPHAGELGRLLGVDSAAVEVKRLSHARDASQLAHAVVVLKGDDTLVAHPDGRVAVSPGASPALATAGTGDVLTGVLSALLAGGGDPFWAACAAVWLHAEAGRDAARRQGSVEGVIASDVIASLPSALGRR
jgi:hydroxyethylthiazole kinase-like uncharacterized protein yjeF